ncbi:MAG: hypothetical protein JWQ19_3931 [Subtercola sp.]|nr:hypothetical protein [Subtercola sp.]
MNDLELTEKAALAAGIPMRTGTPGEFNPLHDDGDAFRLAATLNFRIEPAGPMLKPVDRVIVSVKGKGHIDAEVLFEGDPRAAWRRAIVMTAAALEGDSL